MTVIAKITAYGLDKIIKLIQTNIDNKLRWLDTVNIYGKVQRTEKEEGFYPEVWSSENEYKEIFIDDNVGAIIGFYVKSPRTIDGYYKDVEVDVICTCDLKKIFGNTNRDDERAFNELFDILASTTYVDSLNSMKEGIENVFTDFDTSLIKYRDMQPFYVFSININIRYSSDDC